MDTTAELARRSEAHNADGVAILLTEEGDSTKFLCFLYRSVAVFVERNVLTNHRINHAFNLVKLLVGHFLEMGEVETQRFWAYVRTLLLYVVAENLLQRVVKQVGCGVIRGTCVALVGINARHEVGLNVLRQLLYDVDALSVLSLGIDDFDGLVLADEHATVAYLTTHLAVERRVVEYQFIESILLLSHLAVAQDMAFIFCIVVTYELLFALCQLNPVSVLYGCGVACALFLFLHLCVELLFVHGEAVFAAYQFREVEREAVCIEQTERLSAVQFGLSFGFQRIHCVAQQVYSFLQCAQERVLFLFHYTSDEFLLCRKFRESLAHLLNEYGQQTEHERLFLIEECICVAHGTAQDAANNVSGLCVAWQLSVGDRERNGAQVVGNHAHGDVGLFFLAVLQSCKTFHLVDYRLENVGVIV